MKQDERAKIKRKQCDSCQSRAQSCLAEREDKAVGGWRKPRIRKNGGYVKYQKWSMGMQGIELKMKERESEKEINREWAREEESERNREWKREEERVRQVLVLSSKPPENRWSSCCCHNNDTSWQRRWWWRWWLQQQGAKGQKRGQGSLLFGGGGGKLCLNGFQHCLARNSI